MMMKLKQERQIVLLPKEHACKDGAPSVCSQGCRSSADLGRASPFSEEVSENGY